jgi:hypothetical protein
MPEYLERRGEYEYSPLLDFMERDFQLYKKSCQIKTPFALML